MAVGDLLRNMLEELPDEGEEVEAAEDAADRNRRRTQNARNAPLVSFAQRGLRKQSGVGAGGGEPLTGSAGVARDLKKKFLTARIHHSFAMLRRYEVQKDTPHPNQGIRRGRARCVWSFLCCLAQAVGAVLCGPTQPPVKHIINSIIPDDTNTRLKAAGDQRSRSTVDTVMNQVQNCVVLYERPHLAGYKYHVLPVPCQTAVLKFANTKGTHKAYSAYLIVGSGRLGRKWPQLGLGEQVRAKLSEAQWCVQVMCGDALKANSAMFDLERRQLVHERNKCTAPFLNRLALRLKCSAHQLSLVRRPAVLSAYGFWSTLVRLAHLFECSGFRRRFTTALLTILQEPTSFQRLLAL